MAHSFHSQEPENAGAAIARRLREEAAGSPLARAYSHLCRRQLAGAPVISGLNTAMPPSGTPSSYAVMISSGMAAKSATRRKSRNDVPVDALSVLGAPRLFATSSMLTVRKSMLQRTIFVVFGTVE